MATHLDNMLSRKIPGIEDCSPQEQICARLHTTHVALENEIHRMCVMQPGESKPDYSIVMGECFDVSHDLPQIMRLHAAKAQAGAVRNLILTLQCQKLWDLPECARITDHKWIHRCAC